jgi:hypothetical protein
LYGTVNGGAEWEPVKTRAPLPALVSVHFDTPTSGWAVAADGKVWQSADAGRSWVQEMPAYSRTPAPWYYVSLALVLAFLAPAVPRPVKESAAVAGSPEPVTSAKGSAVDAPKSVGAVANILVSDKPLEEPDPRVDMLELNAIALALSNFLRNENTRPPLTIAVTAKWGAGKTSLMNLTARDLRRFGVQPVYFNPWHHQAEADLAAFLFQSILQRGIPRFLDPTGAGLLFRLKLLRVRWARYRVKAFAVAVTAALILGYLLASGTSPWGALAEFVPAVMALVTWLIAQFNGSGGGASDSPVSGSGASSLVFIGTMIAVIGSIYRGLTSFGVKPAQLLVSSGEASTSKERESKTAFRERFARDFADVTRALDPRDMLILIDDLDRCQHATVLNVLEGVNFLTSNGDCFVMLGMDQEIVRRAVGLGFKELAQEIALYDKPVGWEARTPLELEQMARDKFARQYLEKLVNIFVPVPVAGPEQVAAMLTQGAGGQPAAAKQWSEQEKKNEAERVARDARRRRWVDAARWGVRTASFALLFVLPVALCFYGGTWVYRTLGRIHAPPPQRVATTKPAAPATQPTTVVVTLALPGLNVVMPGISLIGPTTAPSAAGAPDNRAQPTTGPSTQSVDPGNTFGELVKDNGAPAGVAGAPGAAVWWPIGLGMLLAGAGVWLGFFTPDVVTRDSETFSKTLNELRALIYDPERSTPRSVKRFINRVRFIAMRQRRQKSYLTPYDNFVEWLMGLFETKEEKQRKNEEELAAQLRLPRLLTDDVVVALGALQEYLGADWDPKLTFSQLLVKAQEKGLAGDLLDYYTSRSAELSAGLAEYVRLTSGLRVA